MCVGFKVNWNSSKTRARHFPSNENTGLKIKIKNKKTHVVNQCSLPRKKNKCWQNQRKDEHTESAPLSSASPPARLDQLCLRNTMIQVPEKQPWSVLFACWMRAAYPKVAYGTPKFSCFSEGVQSRLCRSLAYGAKLQLILLHGGALGSCVHWSQRGLFCHGCFFWRELCLLCVEQHPHQVIGLNPLPFAMARV